LAPLTCLSIGGKPEDRTLYAGCWDKNIYRWKLSDSNSKASTTRLSGHTDFVKAVLSITLDGKEILVSASADATLIVWDPTTSTRLHTLKGHSRGVQALALESIESSEQNEQGSSQYATIFSGDSNREIRRWHIRLTTSYEIPTTTTSPEDETPSSAPIDPLLVHETSIYALHFDSSGDLHTASADKTAKVLARNRAWDADTVLAHPDFVRDIAVDEAGGWIITACRDEEVRIWSAATGDLHHTYSGHFEEVTGLVVLGSGKAGGKVVSVSIDGTIRQWSLKLADLERAREEVAAGNEEEVVEERFKEKKKSLLTEEEERELAELMDDSE
jgi:WD40 repeat protein